MTMILINLILAYDFEFGGGSDGGNFVHHASKMERLIFNKIIILEIIIVKANNNVLPKK